MFKPYFSQTPTRPVQCCVVQGPEGPGRLPGNQVRFPVNSVYHSQWLEKPGTSKAEALHTYSLIPLREICAKLMDQ